MDRLTLIETELSNALLTIREDTPLPEYTYYNTVELTNLEDECIILDRGNYPAISIYQDPDENTQKGLTQSYYNETSFRLECMVSLDDMHYDTPNFEINKKMNELLSDIKACLAYNSNLNCSCDSVEIYNSFRRKTTNGDERRVGNLVVRVRVKYYQSTKNPNLSCTV